MSGNAAYSLAEWLCIWKSCILIASFHVVFVVSGNPVFSLGKCLSSPEGGSIFIVPAF